MDVVQGLRKEVEALKEKLAQQASQISSVGKMMVKQETETRPHIVENSPTKPRDIPVLELCQLEGIEATTRLQMFIELVEQVSAQDETRVKVAKSRLSPEIAMLVHNRQQRGSFSWPDLCRLLRTEFLVEVNVDKAWQDLDSEQYDWGEESPQVFSNKFVCKYAVLKTKFPAEHFPNRDKTVKRKIWKGLPRELKERTEGFLEEDYPLEKFMEKVNYQRQLWLDGQAQGINKIHKENLNSGNDKLVEDEKDKEVQALKQQVASLSQNLNQLQAQSRTPRQYPPNHCEQNLRPRQIKRRWPPSHPPRFCAYCQTHSHTLEQCRKAPGPGRCFECHRENCRRGNPGCPKWVNSQL